jgi:hypothetical protein
MIPVTHLTTTGPHAGQTFCGNRFRGDSYIHAECLAWYSPDAAEHRKHPPLCPKCWDAWEGTYDATTAATG